MNILGGQMLTGEKMLVYLNARFMQIREAFELRADSLRKEVRQRQELTFYSHSVESDPILSK